VTRIPGTLMPRSARHNGSQPELWHRHASDMRLSRCMRDAFPDVAHDPVAAPAIASGLFENSSRPDVVSVTFTSERPTAPHQNVNSIRDIAFFSMAPLYLP